MSNTRWASWLPVVATKTTVVVLCFAGMVLHASAESRLAGGYYKPAELMKMSTLVFEGKVLAIETNLHYKVAFPTKAAVERVLKGESKEKEMTVKHKHPERNIIVEQEFNTPQTGETGTFYLQDQGGTLILIGYLKHTGQKDLAKPPEAAR